MLGFIRKTNIFKFIYMKKGCLIAIVAVVTVAVLIGVWAVSRYNSFVTKEEGVTSAWSQVENVYQRRADLIPNLVETVKGYATHEQNTLEGVIAARARATQITVNPDDLNAETLQKFQEAQGQLGAALSRLMAVAENYPDLKANQNFLQLQAQLEGTENRIAVERKKFNETTREYNMSVRKFPGNIIAMMFGFDTKPYFEAAEGAEQAPVVDFGN